MNDPLDLTLLRSFVAVIDCGSLQLAAARVGRSQSAVSMQLKRLESDLGRALFQREGRQLRPNAAGQDLLVQARRLLRLSDEVVASLRRTQPAGVVRLGMAEDYAALVLPAVLPGFERDFPLAEIELTFDPSPVLLRHLAAGRLDLALITREPQQPYAVLRREPLVWAASASHAVWARAPLPVALFEAGDTARRFALEALQGADMPYRVVSSTASLMGLLAVAAAGLGVVTLVQSSLPAGLVALDRSHGLPALPVLDLSLVPGPGEPKPLAQLLADRIAQHLS